MSKYCQAICPTASYSTKRRKENLKCLNRATVQFKDGTKLCSRHASKKLLVNAIKNNKVTVIQKALPLTIFSDVILLK